MVEAGSRRSLGVVQRSIALLAALALFTIQGAYAVSEGFSLPGWLFTAVVGGSLLTVAFWGAKRRPAATAAADPAMQAPGQAHKADAHPDAPALDPPREVEERARALAAALLGRDAPAAAPAAGGEPSADAGGSREPALRENAFWLMLGLVSIRQAGGEGEHVKRPDYLKLQHAVLRNIFDLWRAASGGTESLPPEQVDAIRNAMHAVQAAIVKGCSARADGAPHPEQDLLAWFAARTGIGLADSRHVARALKGEPWPSPGEGL